MSARYRLLQRRLHESVAFDLGGVPCVAGGSRFEDGRLAETFITAGKPGCAADVTASEGAIAVSLALQYGCPIEVIVHALPKLADGRPAGIVGTAIFLLEASSAATFPVDGCGLGAATVATSPFPVPAT